VSTLDEEKSKTEYLKEKMKIESLKQDLRILLEKAASAEKFDITQLTAILNSAWFQEPLLPHHSRPSVLCMELEQHREETPMQSATIVVALGSSLY
jgi:hypothetical protein